MNHRQTFDDMINQLLHAHRETDPMARLHAEEKALSYADTLARHAADLTGQSYRKIITVVETAIYNATFGNYDSAYRNVRRAEEWCREAGLFIEV